MKNERRKVKEKLKRNNTMMRMRGTTHRAEAQHKLEPPPYFEYTHPSGDVTLHLTTLGVRDKK